MVADGCDFHRDVGTAPDHPTSPQPGHCRDPERGSSTAPATIIVVDTDYTLLNNLSCLER
jgi:hypothetical protein